MNKLTEREHWDANYAPPEENPAPSGEDTAPATDADATSYKKLLAWLKRHLPASMIDDMSSYSDYLRWSVIVPEHLPSLEGKTMIEVGSAPGTMLIEFHRRTGCIPYGVEYSDPGVELNRANFAANGLDPENVIHSDFFSESFLEENANRFDLVYSGGFIEHFEDVKDVVAKHVDLAAPGGHVFITIPNLRGVNRLLCALFVPHLVPLHNLDIMRLQTFEALFEDPRLEPLLCRYYGSFSFDVIYDGNREDTLRQKIARLLLKTQLPLNLLFRRLFGARGRDSGLTSPYLIYVGRKVSS